MASLSLQIERIWSLSDGTICLLVERESAPRFEICVVRGEKVLRQGRLYARGSAQMLAETWRSTLMSTLTDQSSQPSTVTSDRPSASRQRSAIA
jgi:hypothetical protein